MGNQHPMNLVFGTLIKRYKRFLADICLDNGEIITAHCPNSGKLLGLPADISIRVALTDHGKESYPQRKLRYTWEWFQDGSTWVGVNTHFANRFVEECLHKGLMPEFKAYPEIRREVKYGQNSRIDFLLEGPQGRLYLEVKSVHYKRGDFAVFPDCPTERGAKHLNELASIIDESTKAYVLYFIQRDDCEAFSIAEDIDPLYQSCSDKAQIKGLNVLCYKALLSPETGVTLSGTVHYQ
jgi:sugar fermentation stimulation protein A